MVRYFLKARLTSATSISSTHGLVESCSFVRFGDTGIRFPRLHSPKFAKPKPSVCHFQHPRGPRVVMR